MNRAFRATFRAILFTFLVLAAAEGILRFQEWLTHSPPQLESIRYRRKVFSRIYDHWLTTDNSKPFFPPFRVYSNRNSQDPERLRKIYETTKLPPSQSWKSFDFLQDEKYREETTYSITSNSLGFRGPERERAKPRGVTRIIALGTYNAFGHGIEYRDTYEAQLEEILNKDPARGRFEVWNGGRHAASAIVGLARMTYEILDFHPDLLILDYGFVDTFVWDDNLQPVAMRFPDTSGYVLLRKLIRPLMPLVGRTALWQRFAASYAERTLPAHVEEFHTVMRKMLDIAARAGIPVILVKPFPTEPTLRPIFNRLAGPRVVFVDAEEVLNAHPPTASDYRSVDPAKSWVREMTGSPQRINNFGWYPYKVDMLQLNGHGHRILAEALAIEVRRLLAPTGTYSKPPRR